MKIKFHILIIMFQCFLFSSTYNVFGEVLDLDSQKPLENINVYIKDENIGSATDSDGYFNLSFDYFSSNQINLNIKVIGYEEKVILVDLSNHRINLGKIFLKAKSIEIAPVQIHSHHSHVDKSKQISDIVVGGLELNENLKGSLATTLVNHPNIGINSFGMATSKPSVRGFSGDRFLVTKDGIGTGDLSQSSIDHAIALDMSEISQIEIIRGPKSLIYGPNAIGGVVNTTMTGNPRIRVDKFSTKFLFGSESFSQKGLSLYNQGLYSSVLFYIPIKNNQLNISFNNRDYENQSSPIGMLDNTNSITNNYKIGFSHYTSSGYVNFVSENFEMDYGIPPTSSGHTTGIDIPMLKKTYQVNFHKDILFKNFTNLDMKFNFIDYEHMEIIPDSENLTDDYELLLSKKTQNLKVELNSRNILIGSEVNIKNFESDGINETPVTDEFDVSFYGFYEKESNSGYIFSSSIRAGYFSLKPQYYNYISGNPNLVLEDEEGNPILDENGNMISLVREREFNNVSFSFGLKKKINKFEINSWLMHTMRAPRVEELYSDGPHLATYAFEIGNPNLKSEKIYGIENSIRFSSQPFDFSVVTFYNYSPYYFQMTRNGICEEAWEWDPYSGLGHPCPGVSWIDWGSAPLGWLYIYSPKGNEVVIKGFEFDIGYKLEDFHLDYNLSFTQGDNLSLGLPLSYINPMKEVLSFNLNRKLMTYKIRFSKIHAQDRLGEFETYTPGALLTDVVVSYSYRKHNITMQFNNVFNETHYNHLSRIKSIMPEAGRNVVFLYKTFF